MHGTGGRTQPGLDVGAGSIQPCSPVRHGPGLEWGGCQAGWVLQAFFHPLAWHPELVLVETAKERVPIHGDHRSFTCQHPAVAGGGITSGQEG